MVQVVEYLSTKHKTLSLTLSTAQRKKEKEKKRQILQTTKQNASIPNNVVNN
jgi:hypothetical protein